MIEIKTSYEDEERFISIGKITPKIYAVVTIYRKENIRIISARKARKKEIKEMYRSSSIVGSKSRVSEILHNQLHIPIENRFVGYKTNCA